MKRIFFIVGLALLTVGASLPPSQLAVFFQEAATASAPAGPDFGASLGATAHTSSAGTTVITSTGEAAQDSQVVVVVSWLNDGQSVTSVTDARGNTYALDESIKVGTGSSAQTLAIYSARATTALQTSDAITVNWTTPQFSFRIIAACYLTGVAASTPVDSTAENATTGATIVCSGDTVAANTVSVGAIYNQQERVYTPSWGAVSSTTGGDWILEVVETTSSSAGTQDMNGTFTPSGSYLALWVAYE